MSLDLVSVVMPTRNRAAMLRVALESLRAQTWSELEILVVDDGSDDGSPEVLAAAAEVDRRIRVLRNGSPAGAAAARNRAIRESSGVFVAFMDDDTWWLPPRVETLVRAIQKAGPAVDIAYTPFESIEQDGRRVVMGDGPFSTKYRGVWQAGAVGVLIRRACIERAGGFDPRLPRLQDFDLWVRAATDSGSVYVPELLTGTRRLKGGVSSNPDALLSAVMMITAKYGPGVLPKKDRAMVHHLLGNKLLLQNSWGAGVRQIARGLTIHPWRLGGWAALAGATLGPFPARLSAKVRRLSTTQRFAQKTSSSPIVRYAGDDV